MFIHGMTLQISGKPQMNIHVSVAMGRKTATVKSIQTGSLMKQLCCLFNHQ